MGMWFDGYIVEVFLNDESIDSVRGFGGGALPMATGLGALACAGEPGCAYLYLFVGSDRLREAPDSWASPFITETGAVSPF
jgi:hypothetical protein